MVFQAEHCMRVSDTSQALYKYQPLCDSGTLAKTLVAGTDLTVLFTLGFGWPVTYHLLCEGNRTLLEMGWRADQVQTHPVVWKAMGRPCLIRTCIQTARSQDSLADVSIIYCFGKPQHNAVKAPPRNLGAQAPWHSESNKRTWKVRKELISFLCQVFFLPLTTEVHWIDGF